jgi:hypothetical protein
MTIKKYGLVLRKISKGYIFFLILRRQHIELSLTLRFNPSNPLGSWTPLDFDNFFLKKKLFLLNYMIQNRAQTKMLARLFDIVIT